MGAEAKLYLHEHSIPQLFEGLMTGLIYNRPKEPLKFLETAIAQIRANPHEEVTWDMFIERGAGLEGFPKTRNEGTSRATNNELRSHHNDTKRDISERTKKTKHKEKKKEEKEYSPSITAEQRSHPTMGRVQRSPSVIKAAEVAQIPHVPVILFIGGPGGGKTRHAARVANALADQGLIHICMPDVIRNALAKYKDHYSEWKAANEHYLRGELIPNHLALALVKAEMGRHPEASAFFLEGFPREARQVEDFEREVKSVNMALILDYDEKTLREHMEKRGMGMEIIDQRIKEFKQKTLPSAKYFDDQRLLHLYWKCLDLGLKSDLSQILEQLLELGQLGIRIGYFTVAARGGDRQSHLDVESIPGEKEDHAIFERMRELVRKAMSTGVPILTTPHSERAQTESEQNDRDSTTARPPTSEPAASPPAAESAEAPSSEVAQAVIDVEVVENNVPTPAEPVKAAPPVEAPESEKRPPSTKKREATPESQSRTSAETAAVKKATPPQKEPTPAPKSSTPSTPNARPGTSAKAATPPKPSTAASSRSRDGTPSRIARSREGSRRGNETPKKKETDSPLHPQASRDGSASSAAPSRSRDVGTPASILPSRDGPSPAPAPAQSKEDVSPAASVPKSRDGPSSASAPPRSRNGALPAPEPPRSTDGASPAPTPSKSGDAAPTTPAPPKSREGTSASKKKVDALSTPELSISIPVLLIIGAPGAQKSDLARRVAEKYEGLLLLSMGVLLRTKVKAESEDELWFRVARKMDQGEPVPMKLCRELLYNQLQVDGGAKRGLIIEGYPRTEAQLTDLRNVLGRIDLAILVDCTEQFCMDNIAKRFEEGSGQRPDDSPNVVKTRMALFKQNTLPMLKSLDEKGILRVIEGDSHLDAVFNDVTTILDRELNLNGNESSAVQETADGDAKAP